MALPAVSGQTIQATDLYNLCQPSGGQEKGKWRLNFNASAANYFGGVYIPSESRVSVPVSVSVDTADDSPVNIGSGPTTQGLTSSGFQVVCQSSGGFGNCHCGGNYTISY